MNQQEALRRLERLEAEARAADLERVIEDPKTRAMAQQYADDFDVSVDVLIEESLRLAQRVAEIGQDAFDREFAAELGVTVMELRSEAWLSEQEQKWHEYKER